MTIRQAEQFFRAAHEQAAERRTARKLPEFFRLYAVFWRFAEGKRAGGYVLLIVLLAMLSRALHGPGRVIERSVGIRVREKVSDALYAKLSRLPLAWHEANHSGETLRRVDKTTHALANFAQNQFMYLQNTVNLAGPMIALTLISLTVGATAMVGYLLIGLVIINFDRIMMRLLGLENEAEQKYTARLLAFPAAGYLSDQAAAA